MADALAELNKGDLKERVVRMRASLARARVATRETVRRGTGVLATSAGGFAAGVIDDRVPEVGGLPTGLAVGGALALAGAMGLAGDQSDLLCDFGSGMLAGAAYGKGIEASRDLAKKS
jgi:hypothetical protein